MNRFLSLVSILSLFALGCPVADTGDDDATADDCSSSTTEYTCENGYCTCDDNQASCTDPETPTADDAQSCDNVCFECLD